VPSRAVRDENGAERNHETVEKAEFDWVSTPGLGTASGRVVERRGSGLDRTSRKKKMSPRSTRQSEGLDCQMHLTAPVREKGRKEEIDGGNGASKGMKTSKTGWQRQLVISLALHREGGGNDYQKYQTQISTVRKEQERTEGSLTESERPRQEDRKRPDRNERGSLT